MNPFGISDKSYQLILKYFSSNKDIKKVVLFGSRAIETYHNGSGIDFAIWGVNINDIRIKMDLEELQTPYMYDVINYDNLDKEELKNHIDIHGKVFFEQQ